MSISKRENQPDSLSYNSYIEREEEVRVLREEAKSLYEDLTERLKSDPTAPEGASELFEGGRVRFRYIVVDGDNGYEGGAIISTYIGGEFDGYTTISYNHSPHQETVDKSSALWAHAFIRLSPDGKFGIEAARISRFQGRGPGDGIDKYREFNNDYISEDTPSHGRLAYSNGPEICLNEVRRIVSSYISPKIA